MQKERKIETRRRGKEKGKEEMTTNLINDK